MGWGRGRGKGRGEEGGGGGSRIPGLYNHAGVSFWGLEGWSPPDAEQITPPKYINMHRSMLNELRVMNVM